MEIRQQEIFRPNVRLSTESLLSDVKIDKRLSHTGYLRIASLIIFISILPIFFINVSLGVTAFGIVTYESKSNAILAERDGVITWVASERELSNVRQGSRVAEIRSTDRASMSAQIDEKYVLESLKARQSIVSEKIHSLKSGIEKDTLARTVLMDGLKSQIQAQEKISTFYDELSDRLSSLVEKYKSYKTNGFVTEAQLEQYRQLMSETEGNSLLSKIQIESLSNEISRTALEYQSRSTYIEQDLYNLNNEYEQLQMDIETEMVNLNGTHFTQVAGTLVPRGYAPGQTVNVGDVLFYVSDNDDPRLQFEVDVTARDVGDIKSGQKVKVSFDSYPYFEHGFIDGVVGYVSQTPNQHVSLNLDLPSQLMYRIIINPEEESLSAFQKDKYLIEGMSIEVHIKKEKTAIWRLLFSPLLKLGSRFYT